MKKLISTLLAIALSMFAISASAAVPDEEWRYSPPPTSDASWGILAEGISQSYTLFAHPQLMSFKADKYEFGTGKVLEVKVCHSFVSSDCPHDQYQHYGAPLGMCNAQSSDCIEEVGATTTSGEKLKVNFLRDFPGNTGGEFVGDKSANLPTSGSTFLVDVPGAPHASGSLYLISSIINGSRMPVEEKFSPGILETSIWPVRLTSGQYEVIREATDPRSYTGLGVLSGAAGTNCAGVQNSTTECAMPEAAPLDVAFSLKFKLSTLITGWLSGRISNVDAKLSRDESGVQHLFVKALPVRVPTIFGWVKKSDSPPELSKFYADMDPFYLNMGIGYGGCLLPTDYVGPCTSTYWNSLLRGPGNSPQGMKELAMWLPLINDTAVAAPTAWYFHNERGNIGDRCIDKQVQINGLVTTNATVILPGPPTYNAFDGTLDYKVLAPHALPDGSIFKGTYDLIISSTLARCLYNFTSAPIRATVSIVSDSGVAQVATTTISEGNGFIHLAANGFTFSNPTIKVKLSQKSLVPNPVLTASNSKKVTITCVKGKTVKKVTAVKPVCPKGFKKK